MRSPLSRRLEEQKTNNVKPKIGDLVETYVYEPTSSYKKFGFIVEIGPLLSDEDIYGEKGSPESRYPYKIYVYDDDNIFCFKESEFNVLS